MLLQASYKAEAHSMKEEHQRDAMADGTGVDQQAQHIVALEGVLVEYKTANARLGAELDAFGWDAEVLHGGQ